MTPRTLLYFSFSTLLLSTYFLVLILLGGCKPGLINDKPTFAIKDTSQVDQIQITEANGNSIVIQRRTTPSTWKLNSGDFDAREDAVDLILETIYRIKIKQEVDESSRDNIINQIAASNKKVDFFKQNAETPFKTYYVGNSTPDKLGTFMVMSENKDGKWSSLTRLLSINLGCTDILKVGFFQRLMNGEVPRFSSMEEELFLAYIFNFLKSRKNPMLLR